MPCQPHPSRPRRAVPRRNTPAEPFPAETHRAHAACPCLPQLTRPCPNGPQHTQPAAPRHAMPNCAQTYRVCQNGPYLRGPIHNLTNLSCRALPCRAVPSHDQTCLSCRTLTRPNRPCHSWPSPDPPAKSQVADSTWYMPYCPSFSGRHSPTPQPKPPALRMLMICSREYWPFLLYLIVRSAYQLSN